MPLLNFLIDSIAAAALVYVAVAFILSLSAKFTMPKRQASPGQLSIDFAAVEPIAVMPAAEETEDVWSVEVEPIAAPTIPAAVPMFTTPPYLLLLPAAIEVPTVEIMPPAAVPNWAAMPSSELRKACQARGKKWRNARPDGKHLSKPQMIAALVAA